MLANAGGGRGFQPMSAPHECTDAPCARCVPDRQTSRPPSASVVDPIFTTPDKSPRPWAVCRSAAMSVAAGAEQQLRDLLARAPSVFPPQQGAGDYQRRAVSVGGIDQPPFGLAVKSRSVN
jgi:hypothetical protein